MQRLGVLTSVGLDNCTVACTLVFLFSLIALAAWARPADDAMDEELEPDAVVPDEAYDGCPACTVYTACTVPAVTAGCFYGSGRSRCLCIMHGTYGRCRCDWW